MDSAGNAPFRVYSWKTLTELLSHHIITALYRLDLPIDARTTNFIKSIEQTTCHTPPPPTANDFVEEKIEFLTSYIIMQSFYDLQTFPHKCDVIKETIQNAVRSGLRSLSQHIEEKGY